MATSGGLEGILRDFGFPVVICLWFMIRMEKRVDRLFVLFNSLLRAMHTLAISVDHNGGKAKPKLDVESIVNQGSGDNQ